MRGFAVAALVAGMAVPAAAQLRLSGAEGDVLVFRTPAKVEVVESFALDPGEAEALAVFKREASYYGALYVDPTGDDNAVNLYGMHSLAAAEALAEAGCSDYAGEGGRCVLYARVIPEGYPADLQGGATISQAATEDFVGDFLANKEPGLNGAFAVSGVADWIYYLLPDSREALSDRAKVECEASAKANAAALPPAIQRLAESGPYLSCQVIYFRYSDG